MKIMQPVIKDAHAGTIEVAVENGEIAKMMDTLRTRLTAFMREPLHHNSIDITFVVPEKTAETIKSFDKREQLRHFCDLNPAFITLGKTFKLELS